MMLKGMLLFSVVLGAGVLMGSSTAFADDALIAQGKILFDETAGDVGCAFCHGLDGKGDGPAQVNAANIRAARETTIRAALGGTVAMMEFITLSEAEIAAIAAYLEQLGAQM